MGWKRDRMYSFGDGVCRIYPQNDPKFPEGALWEAINCVYALESDNPEAMRGASRMGSTDMGGAVTGLFDYNTGTKLIASCADGKFYVYAGSDFAAGSGARATGNSTAGSTRWSGAMFYSDTAAATILTLGNGIDDPVKYDGTSFTALGGTAPAAANFPTVWQGRLWWATGSTLIGSAANNSEQYDTASGGINIQVYRGTGNITGLFAFATNLFIFKRDAIFRISPTSTFSETNVRNVSMSIGCVSHRTIQEAGEKGTSLLFKSARGVEALEPNGSYSGFGIANVSRYVQAIISRANETSESISFGVYNLKRKEYWINYSLGTTSSTVTKEGLCCNMARPSRGPRWTQWDRQNLTAGTIYQESGTSYKQLVGDSSGRVYMMHVDSEIDWNGSPITGRIQTKYYVGDFPENMKVYNWVFVDVKTEGNYSVSVNLGILRPGLPSPSIGNTQVLTRTSDDDGWGVGEWGVALWGGSGTSGERIRPRAVRRGIGLKTIISSTNWFRLNGLVTESEVRKSTLVA